jgi:hypothetical protein
MEIDRVKTLANDIKVASLIYVLKKENKNIEVDSNKIKKFLAEENTLRATLSKIRSESNTKRASGLLQRWYQGFISYFT